MSKTKEFIYCKKHGEPEHYHYTDQLDFEKIKQCVQCQEENLIISQFNEINSKLTQIINKLKNNHFKALNQIFQKFYSIKALFQSIDPLINFIIEISETLKMQDQKTKKSLEKFYDLTAEQIQVNHQNYKKMWQNLEKNFKIQIQNIQQQQKIDEQYRFVANRFASGKENYCYTLLKQPSVYCQESCRAMCFNQNYSILVAGCTDKIKVFNFQNKQLLQIQELDGFESEVNCLQFVPCIYENQFISAFQDGLIFIWKYNKGNYIKHQQLKGHNGKVNCIELFEDRIVSAGNDCRILFWHKFYDKWIVHQEVKSQGSILSLSFENGCTKFISSEEKQKVLIYESNGREWIVSHIIQLQSDALRLKLFQNQILCFQVQSDQLSIYKLSGDKYEKDQEIKLQGIGQDVIGFPIYLAKNGFVVKHSNYVSLLVKTKNKQTKLKQGQTIQFDTENFIGCMCNNEKYLITWDETSKEFKIRQWMMIN